MHPARSRNVNALLNLLTQGPVGLFQFSMEAYKKNCRPTYGITWWPKRKSKGVGKECVVWSEGDLWHYLGNRQVHASRGTSQVSHHTDTSPLTVTLTLSQWHFHSDSDPSPQTLSLWVILPLWQRHFPSDSDPSTLPVALPLWQWHFHSASGTFPLTVTLPRYRWHFPMPCRGISLAFKYAFFRFEWGILWIYFPFRIKANTSHLPR